MAKPSPRTGISYGHPFFLVFSGSNDIKTQLQADEIGMIFDGDVSDDTIHGILVDPRYSPLSVSQRITELGGVVYTPPPPE